MEDADFSDEFCRFVHGTLPSVDAAEVLLYLYREPGAGWLPRQIAEGLRGVRVSEADTAKYLQGFAASGLAAAQPDGGYRYAPANPTIGGYVQTLALAYEQRPVTLIRLIYALRDGKIRSFADAFKLRKR